MKAHTIREFGIIYNKQDYPDSKDSFNNIYINKRAFINLKNFISENVEESEDIDNAFIVFRKKGKDFIKVKNFVGVVETKDGTIIEILPKILLNNDKDQTTLTRKIFLKMLRHLKNSPFKSINTARLKTTNFPILEIFIFSFLVELEKVVKNGIRSHYQNVNQNVKYLKGTIDFNKQLQDNLIHKERFFVRFDEFNKNIPHNRIIKSCLNLLLKKTSSSKNKMRISNFLILMDAIKESENIEKDFMIIKESNRLFTHYDRILQWAKVFLKGESFTNFKGNSLNKAILFPMEKIFEDYIAYGFKKYTPHFDISVQDKSKFLIDNHANNSKFRLKPDIVLSNDNNLYILDTKWKIINQHDFKKNYGINQADMYQLFAYAKKYSSFSKSLLLVLLYPINESFTTPLKPFIYEDKLTLLVLPVNLSISLENTINSIIEEINK